MQSTHTHQDASRTAGRESSQRRCEIGDIRGLQPIDVLMSMCRTPVDISGEIASIGLNRVAREPPLDRNVVEIAANSLSESQARTSCSGT